MRAEMILEFAPKGFDPTNEIEWFEVEHYSSADYVKLFSFSDPTVHKQVVLCQKWEGAFRSVWVRIPIREK